MNNFSLPAPTLILLLGLVFLFLLILFGRSSSAKWGAGGALCFLVVAAISIGHSLWFSLPERLYFDLLVDRPYLRLPRLTFFLSTLLVFRSFMGTTAVPRERLGQATFLVLVLTFLGDVVLLSNNFLMTFTALSSMALVGALVVGISFRGGLEGEAVLKNWNQAAFFVPIGLFCCFLVTLMTGGLGFMRLQESTAIITQAWPLYAICFLLFLPFLLAGALFPFHFLSIDRDQGANWATQLLFANCVQAPVMVGLWSLSYQLQLGNPLWPGGKVLMALALLGCFWQGAYALGQKSARRILSSFTGAHWSFALIAAAGASQKNLEAAIIGFSSCFVWIAARGFIWSRFQEAVGSDNLLGASGVVGGAQKKGLLLLFALAPAFFVPGLPSFPALIHHFSAMLEHRSILLFLTSTLFLVLVSLTPLRILSELLFLPAAAPAEWRREIKYDALDWGSLFLVLSVMLLIGLAWPTLLIHVGASPKLFH